MREDVADGGEQRDLKVEKCYRCKKFGYYANSCKVPWCDVNYTDHGEEQEMRDYPRSNQRRDRPEECHISLSDCS